MNTPGLTFISRDNVPLSESWFDHPLSGRFDEPDTAEQG
jgi:aromatic ring hydroxylase